MGDPRALRVHVTWGEDLERNARTRSVLEALGLRPVDHDANATLFAEGKRPAPAAPAAGRRVSVRG